MELSTVASALPPSTHRQFGLPQRRRGVTTEPQIIRGLPPEPARAPYPYLHAARTRTRGLIGGWVGVVIGASRLALIQGRS
jgi:hypothetical protein